MLTRLKVRQTQTNRQPAAKTREVIEVGTTDDEDNDDDDEEPVPKAKTTRARVPPKTVAVKTTKPGPSKPIAGSTHEARKRAMKRIQGQMLTLQGRMKSTEAEMAEMGAEMGKLVGELAEAAAHLNA